MRPAYEPRPLPCSQQPAKAATCLKNPIALRSLPGPPVGEVLCETVANVWKVIV